MSRPWFDSRLVLVSQYDPDTGDTNPSPLAKGPIDPGDIIKWIAVWIFQDWCEGRGAAATGRSEYDEDFQNEWKVETFLVKGSDHFDTDEPALAMALALIWRAGDENRREFYWWVHPVILDKESK
jgi:hypothetical protein